MPDPTSTHPESPLHPAARRPWLVAGVLVLVFILTAWPVILSGSQRGRMAADQIDYHELVVRQFLADFPRPDFSDYRSATTPGYHFVVAAAARVVGDSRVTLQILGSLFTIALLGVLGWAVGTRAPPTMALALCAPVLASLYVWPAGVWLLPDNAGWLGVLAILLIALRSTVCARTYLVGGVVLALLVFMRQIHLWPAACLWTAAWLGSARDEDPASPYLADEWHALTREPKPRFARAGLAIAATLPAFAVVAAFASLWGGLTPPMFQGEVVGEVGHQGLNPAAAPFVLSIFAIVSVFYLGFLGAPIGWMLTRGKRWALVAAIAGAAVALLPATTFDQDAGRWTGLWNIAGALPSMGGRTSLLILLLSAAGGVFVLLWALAVPRRDRWVLLAALVAFMAAMTASQELWQRYVEPAVLMLVILLAVRTAPVDPRSPMHLARLGGPLLLGVAFAALTAYKIATSPVHPG